MIYRKMVFIDALKFKLFFIHLKVYFHPLAFKTIFFFFIKEIDESLFLINHSIKLLNRLRPFYGFWDPQARKLQIREF